MTKKVCDMCSKKKKRIETKGLYNVRVTCDFSNQWLTTIFANHRPFSILNCAVLPFSLFISLSRNSIFYTTQGQQKNQNSSSTHCTRKGRMAK